MKRAKRRLGDTRSTEGYMEAVSRKVSREGERLAAEGKLIVLHVEPAPETFPAVKKWLGDAS